MDRRSECWVGKELGAKDKVGLLHLVSHGFDDIVMVFVVVREELDSYSATGCEAAVGCCEFCLFEAIVHEESVLGMDRVVVKVEATVPDSFVPSMEYAVGFNVREAGVVGHGDWWIG